MTMEPSAKCLAFIRAKERLSLKVYDDGGGVPTQGWGHTGPEVKWGNPDITVDRAAQWFRADVAEAAAEVDRRTVGIPLTQGMFDCLVSFEFNTGGLVIGLGQPSRVLVALRERRWNDAIEELVRWNMDNGEHRRGLLMRRLEEGLLFTSEPYPRG